MYPKKSPVSNVCYIFIFSNSNYTEKGKVDTKAHLHQKKKSSFGGLYCKNVFINENDKDLHCLGNCLNISTLI